jgi:hypothetical protein
MLDWLLVLPGHPDLARYRLDLCARTAWLGSNRELADLTPLQLATKLGDRAMVRWVLMKHTKIDWTWGPMTQKLFDLSEIDSINVGGNDVMELVCRLDASPKTREMIGVNFMQGFIFALFQEKFNKFAYIISYLFTAVDLLYLCYLYYLTYSYRESCLSTPYHLVIPLLVIITVIVVVDLEMVLAWMNNPARTSESRQWSPERRGSVSAGGTAAISSLGPTASGLVAVKHHASCATRTCFGYFQVLLNMPWGALWAQIRDYHIHFKIVSVCCSIIACIFLLSLNGRGSLSAAALTRSIGLGEGALCSPHYPDPDMISFVLSIALFFHSLSTFLELLFRFENLCVYAQFIARMLLGSMVKWFVMFFSFLVLFAVTMHAVYPQVPQFRTFFDSFIALLLTASIGEPLEDFPPLFYDGLWSSSWPGVGTFGTPNGIAFFLLYVMWIYIATILLLNLLIAQMGDEYETLKEQAGLGYRLGFARRVLRTELFTCKLFGQAFAERMLRVGTHEAGSDPPTYYYTYIEVGRNFEGKRIQDGVDLFDDLSDDEDSTTTKTRSR